jgi:hypothetical protein
MKKVAGIIIVLLTVTGSIWIHDHNVSRKKNELINMYDAKARFKDSLSVVESDWGKVPEEGKANFLSSKRASKAFKALKGQWSDCGKELIFKSPELDKRFQRILDYDFKLFIYANARS